MKFVTLMLRKKTVKLLSLVPMMELMIIGTSFIPSRGDTILTIGNRIKLIRKTNKVDPINSASLTLNYRV